MRGFVDRIVDGVAVVLLDGGGRAYIPASALPPATEGGQFVEVTIARAEAAAGESAEEIAALIERLRSGEHRHG